MKLSREKSDFFQNVYAVARLIPAGRISTYGAIAQYLGAARSARMVGWAMNNSLTQNVPAHRVVNRIGALTGKQHFSHPFEMQELLEAEGIKVVEDCVQDFENILWDPLLELDIDDN